MIIDFQGLQTYFGDPVLVLVQPGTGTPAATLTPAAATLAYSAGTPTAAFSGTQTLAPSAGALAYSEGTPAAALSGTLTFAPSAGTFAYSAGTPSVVVGIPISPGPAALSLFYRTFTTGVSPVFTTATGNQLFIGSVSYGTWMADTFKIDKNLNSTYTGSVSLRYRADLGQPKPVVKQEAAMFWEGVKRFGGIIQQVDESAIYGDPNESQIDITFTGYGSYLDRTVVGKLYTEPIGGVVAIILFDLWINHLLALGVNFTFGSGPAVGIGDTLFPYITLRQACTVLTDQTPGWNIWIDNNKTLQLQDTGAGGGGTAPFVLSRASLLNSQSADSLKLTISDLLFRNREWVIPSANLVSLMTDTATGDGVTLAFATTYSLSTGTPIVFVNGLSQTVDVLGTPTGAPCYYVPGGVGVFFHVAPGAGLEVDISYPSPFQLAFMAEDAASIAAVGVYEHVTQGSNVVDSLTATTMAQALLDLYGPGGISPQSITYAYNSAQQDGWLEPGMLQTVNWTFPDISDNYVVQEVQSEEQGLGIWRHTVTLALGPTGDLTGAADLQALVAALRQPNNTNSETAVIQVAPTVGGVINPGVAGGPVPQVYIFSQPGVLWYWSAIFANPPSGSPIIMQLQINGIPVLGALPYQKIIIPVGNSGLIQGFQFANGAEPVLYKAGDVLSVFVLQAGGGVATDGTISVVGLRST